MPVHTIPVAVADATSPETPASQGIGLPSEGVHMHILPTLIYLLSASFSHLVQEDAQGKGPITKDRIEEVLQFYGQQTDLNTRNLCEIVETLAPALMFDFCASQALNDMTETLDLCTLYDSRDKPRPRKRRIPTEEAETYHDLFRKQRHFFLDAATQCCVVFYSKGRLTVPDDKGLRPKPFRTLLYILLHARSRRILINAIKREVWGPIDMPSDDAWNDNISRMHSQTGKVLTDYIHNEPASRCIWVDVDNMPSYAMLWLDYRKPLH